MSYPFYCINKFIMILLTLTPIEKYYVFKVEKSSFLFSLLYGFKLLNQGSN